MTACVYIDLGINGRDFFFFSQNEGVLLFCQVNESLKLALETSKELQRTKLTTLCIDTRVIPAKH